MAPCFKDRVVLDVGSGTGILSMIVAKHTEARLVYAIEANKDIAMLSRKMIEKNELQDRITVIEGTVEHLIESKDCPIAESVDILISEWMGHYLLHESMLDSVLLARDQWLQKSKAGSYYKSIKVVENWDSKEHGGLILPLMAIVYGTFCDATKTIYEREGWMCDADRFFFFFLSGLDELRRLKDEEDELVLTHLDTVPEWTESTELVKFNLATAQSQDLNTVHASQLFAFNKSTATGFLNGFLLWFDCIFPTCTSEALLLSTGPGKAQTHWKQSLIIIPEDGVPVLEGALAEVEITLARKSPQDRRYNLTLEIPILIPPP
eukprot:Protomagalhaensia_wolfi_Nauph_80__1396@NODE_1838_length_1313_cov_368_385400_g1374_i1_p1_GENE_NODE_1838_length_1313_cov_368_385400_g1374_i1NODE_1838_length_1313_cov_368_385400_g1374_i1_p1_ORF_typecomplete_len367_score51_91PrmA/PF06325_13/1_7e16MTS/PF05175_14/3_1e12PRMT5/PF05185_16/1_6e10Met_10/PF02475_16/1_7e10Methyltransf_25/PF13649_6/2_1e09Methyltransf_31/PF13847_6/4_7e09Methyltransf_18/PF12847_7/9_1e09DOT1/PF08123_13/4_4e08Cons_hypoth95/PF03602_15/8_3e08Methyltransf_3/PF01596_17/1_4e07PCMT/PF0